MLLEVFLEQYLSILHPHNISKNIFPLGHMCRLIMYYIWSCVLYGHVWCHIHHREAGLVSIHRM